MVTYRYKAGRDFYFCPSYNNVCSKPSTHKTKLKENENEYIRQG